MARGQWTTPPQRTWLEALVPAFVKAQQDKTTSTLFFPQLHKDYQALWPVESPTPAELIEAGGDEVKSMAKKKKAIENVSVNWAAHVSNLTYSLSSVFLTGSIIILVGPVLARGREGF